MNLRVVLVEDEGGRHEDALLEAVGPGRDGQKGVDKHWQRQLGVAPQCVHRSRGRDEKVAVRVRVQRGDVESARAGRSPRGRLGRRPGRRRLTASARAA